MGVCPVDGKFEEIHAKKKKKSETDNRVNQLFRSHLSNRRQQPSKHTQAKPVSVTVQLIGDIRTRLYRIFKLSEQTGRNTVQRQQTKAIWMRCDAARVDQKSSVH